MQHLISYTPHTQVPYVPAPDTRGPDRPAERCMGIRPLIKQRDRQLASRGGGASPRPLPPTSATHTGNQGNRFQL